MNRALGRWGIAGVLASSLATLYACSGDGYQRPAPGGAGGAGGGSGAGSAPTFYEDVAPIVSRSCAGCHAPGGIAPFSLVTWEDARPHADDMKQLTASRVMPPWLADNSGHCNTYRDARWLSDDEIATIGAWAEGGAQKGDPAHAPGAPPPAAALDRVDAVLDMGAPYTPDASLSDEYRCFVVDPGLASDRFIVGYDVRPGDPRVVHHIIAYALDDANQEAQAASLDAADPGPGYTCFGDSRVVGARLVVGWAPGVGVGHYPEGTGLRLHAGHKVVLQVHYNLANGSFPDQTRIALELIDSVSSEAYITPIADLSLSLPPGEAQITQSAITTVPLLLGTWRVWGVFPHMHGLGTALRVNVEHAGAQSCVVDVPRWSFHWQQMYFYQQPLSAFPGDQVRISCTYDTRTRTDTVTWGENTTDEMCLAFFYVTH
jgi:hypothetical protein